MAILLTFLLCGLISPSNECDGYIESWNVHAQEGYTPYCDADITLTCACHSHDLWMSLSWEIEGTEEESGTRTYLHLTPGKTYRLDHFDAIPIGYWGQTALIEVRGGCSECGWEAVPSIHEIEIQPNFQAIAPSNECNGVLELDKIINIWELWSPFAYFELEMSETCTHPDLEVSMVWEILEDEYESTTDTFSVQPNCLQWHRHSEALPLGSKGKTCLITLDAWCNACDWHLAAPCVYEEEID